MDRIIIIGSSGHAKVVSDIVEKEGKYSLLGFLDRSREVGEETLGYKVIGKEEDLPRLLEECDLKGGIVAIGDNYKRSQVVRRISEIAPRFPFLSTMHPNARIAKWVRIGDGTVIMGGCSVGPCSSIGSFCILHTNCSLDHDSVMGDFSSLAPNCATGGNVHIGSFTAVGIGATVKNEVRIGNHSVIGAGSVVLKDVGDYKVAYGIPASEKRVRSRGEEYF